MNIKAYKRERKIKALKGFIHSLQVYEVLKIVLGGLLIASFAFVVLAVYFLTFN